MRKFLIFSAVILLSGCGFFNQSSPHSKVETLAYQCDEGPLVVQEDTTYHQVSFLLGDEFLVLTQGLSGTGKRFTDGVYVYWVQKDTATVYRHDWVELHNCKQQPASAV